MTLAVDVVADAFDAAVPEEGAGSLMLTAADEVAPETAGDEVAAFAQPVNAPAAKAALMMIDIQSRFMVVPSFPMLERMLQTVPESFLKRNASWFRWLAKGWSEVK